MKLMSVGHSAEHLDSLILLLITAMVESKMFLITLKAPGILIVKSRDHDGYGWYVYHIVFKMLREIWRSTWSDQFNSNHICGTIQRLLTLFR